MCSYRSLALPGGGPDDNPKVVELEGDVVITNIALGEKIADEKSRTTVKLSYIGPNAFEESEDEEDDDENDKLETSVLCSLTPGKVRSLLNIL